MKKVGIVVKKLDYSQKCFEIINEFNNLLKKKFDLDVVLLYSDLGQTPINSCFGSMHINLAYDYDGILIALDLESAYKILRLPSASKYIYYPQNIDWYGSYRHSFEECAQIYTNKKLDFWCRSNDHAIAIKNAWNINPTIFNRDLEKLIWQDDHS